jgi:hypothetical protein
VSIYRRRNWIGLDSDHQWSESRKATTPAASSPDWSKARKALPLERLLPASEAWIKILPCDVYPVALAAKYPRIVNLIASAWDNRAECPMLFEELLGDQRGQRQGFPADVKRDLEKLRDCWYGGSVR